MATEMPARRLSVEISDSLHHRLRLLALEERTTLAAIVRELLEREIERRQTPSPATSASPARREIVARKTG